MLPALVLLPVAFDGMFSRDEELGLMAAAVPPVAG
jgi:hypothetical protein